MSPHRSRAAAGAARLLAAVLLPLHGCGAGDPTPDAAARPLPVEARPVSLQDGYATEELHTGRVVSRRSSDLGFDRAGRLASVEVDEGDRVEAGERLAALDTRELRAELRRVEAQIAEIRAELAMAKLTTQRRRALRASDHVAPEQLDQAIHAQQALEARLGAARAAREGVAASLALSEIRAPYAGSITARLADEGTIVTPGAPILRLIEDGALEAHIGVPPEAAAALEVGRRHPLEIEGQRAQAELRAVVEAVERDTRTVTAIFRLPPDAPGALDGSLVRVPVTRRIPGEGFWLPLEALGESHRGLWSAYVVVADEEGSGAALRADRRQVEVLHVEAGRAFVRGTLRDGERVVWSGAHRLVPGQRVELLQEAADGARAALSGEPRAAGRESGSGS